MADRDKAAVETERPGSLEEIAAQIQSCRRCPIGCNGTRAVAGEGPKRARLMIVGEQPGDVEERLGRPFVGPAGRLLRSHLEDVGIDEGRAYVTNVVKHFKWVPRGKRRLHQKPGSLEIRACRPWLDQEIELIRPAVLVCLGATAAKALLGAEFKVSVDRGRPVESPLAPFVLATVHPSSLLRGDDDMRAQEIEHFTADLRIAANAAKQDAGR